MFQFIKENSFQPILKYVANLSFKTSVGIMSFHNKEHLKNFMVTKIALEKIFKDILERYREPRGQKACKDESIREAKQLRRDQTAISSRK